MKGDLVQVMQTVLIHYKMLLWLIEFLKLHASALASKMLRVTCQGSCAVLPRAALM